MTINELGTAQHLFGSSDKDPSLSPARVSRGGSRKEVGFRV